MSAPWEMRPKGMPAEHVIEAYALDEAEPAERAAVEAWLAEHPEFAEVLAARRAGFEALPTARPDLMRTDILQRLAAAPRPQRRVPWWAWLMGPAMVGAALFLALRSQPVQPEFRVKGSIDFDMFRARGDQPQQLFDGDAVHPGDRLRFKPTFPEGFPEGGHLIVVGVEDDGSLFAYAPAAASSAAPRAELDAEGVLPGAATLDETLGPEVAHIVWCPRSFDLGDLRRAKSADEERLEIPDGCHANRHRFARVPP